MKTRRKFIDKVKQVVWAQDKIKVLMLLVVPFIAGFLVSWNFLDKAVFSSILIGILTVFLHNLMFMLCVNFWKFYKG